MAGPGVLSFTRTEKYCTKLADEVMKLRGEKCLMDFKIHVKDEEFPCAKFVMAAHSPMLRVMLTSDMTEVAKQEIRLDHISKGIIQIILDYMYCENVSFHQDQLMDLLAASDYLQMTELKERCLDEVPDILEPSNVIEWWKEAAKMNYDTIKDKCEEIMIVNFKQISQQADFLALDLREVQYYLSDICSDSVHSDDTVDAVIRWAGHNEERISLLQDLMPNIQLNQCSDEGIEEITKIHESLLDKTPMVYKLLLKTSASIRAATAKSVTDTVVIVGGEEGEEVSPVCWKVDQSNEVVHLCDIPASDLTRRLSVCVIPNGFVLTGGANKFLCMMFFATTKSWVRMQDMLKVRQCHGSISVNGFLYVLGGYVDNDDDPSDSVDLIMVECGSWQNGPNIPLAVKLWKQCVPSG